VCAESAVNPLRMGRGDNGRAMRRYDSVRGAATCRPTGQKCFSVGARHVGTWSFDDERSTALLARKPLRPDAGKRPMQARSLLPE